MRKAIGSRMAMTIDKYCLSMVMPAEITLSPPLLPPEKLRKSLEEGLWCTDIGVAAF